MGFTETVALGAIAGGTIFLGLPLGRIRGVDDRLRVCLAMFSVGILAFIFMDVTKHGEQIIETSVTHYRAHTASFGHVLGLFALLTAGFTVGTAGISAVERRLRSRRSAPAPLAGGEATAVLSAEQLARAGAEEVRQRALQTGMVIAMAIGLRNDRRLPGQLQSARAAVLRPSRRRDPLCDRRDLDGHAPLRASHPRPLPDRSRLPRGRGDRPDRLLRRRLRHMPAARLASSICA